MTEVQGPREPRRYCTGCGAQVRPENAFCVSCGASVDASGEEPGPMHQEAVSPEPSGPDAGGREAKHESVSLGLSDTASTSREGTPGGLARNAAAWFGGLSVLSKAVLIGTAVLVLVPWRPLAILVLVLLLGLIGRALIAWMAPLVGQGTSTKLIAGVAGVVGLVLLVDLAWTSGTPGENRQGSSPADKENAEQLLIAMRYEDPDQRVIEDVAVSGTGATVTVRQELEESDADYVCSYALDASSELYELGSWESGGNDFADRLLEVTVLGPGTSTSCRSPG